MFSLYLDDPQNLHFTLERQGICIIIVD